MSSWKSNFCLFLCLHNLFFFLNSSISSTEIRVSIICLFVFLFGKIIIQHLSPLLEFLGATAILHVFISLGVNMDFMLHPEQCHPSCPTTFGMVGLGLTHCATMPYLLLISSSVSEVKNVSWLYISKRPHNGGNLFSLRL